MPEVPDYDLRRTDDEQAPLPPRRRGPSLLLVVIGGLVVVAAVTIYFLVGRGPRPAVHPASAPAAQPSPPAAAAPERPLGGAAAPIALPPLDESDPAVRDLVTSLSSHPKVLDWLGSTQLIRNFTAVSAGIAGGRVPRALLQALAPSSPFRVVTRGSELYVDPASYDRFNGIAAAGASIDPAAAARVYSQIKPRVEDAFAELGAGPVSFDRTLERAIVLLLQTPVIDGPVRVESRGALYAFADPRLEGLAPAQKQLLRMGPSNVRTIQSSLRAFALALGIPADRLPPPPPDGPARQP